MTSNETELLRKRETDAQMWQEERFIFFRVLTIMAKPYQLLLVLYLSMAKMIYLQWL